MTQTCEEIEFELGEAPWTGVSSLFVNWKNATQVASWLELKGMAYNKLSELSYEQLAKCYKIKPYFDVVCGNKPKRIMSRYEKQRVRSNFENGKLSIDTLFNPVLSLDEEEKELRDTELEDANSLQSEKPLYSDPQWTNNVAYAINNAVEARLERLKSEVTGAAAVYLLPKLDGKITDQVQMQIAQMGISEKTKNEVAAVVIKTLAENLPSKRIEIIDPKTEETKDLGLQHEKFETLLRACSARDHKGFRLNIWLTGPTGSGKTSSAESVAKALDLPFASDGSLDADYKVLGFRDANGNIISTEFLRVFANGGIYCADEIDNWLPSALLSLNAALANGWVSTPGGQILRHKDFICIACANTWGLGATSDYVGRTRLDAASLDRFQPKISWPYDEKLELALSQDDAWCKFVQHCRQKAKDQGLKIIISPRATYNGCALLQAGFDAETVAEMTIGAGLSNEQKKAIGLDMAIYIKFPAEYAA